jgi:hypothetical protein
VCKGPRDQEGIEPSCCNLIPSDVLMKISVCGIVFFFFCFFAYLVLNYMYNLLGKATRYCVCR